MYVPIWGLLVGRQLFGVLQTPTHHRDELVTCNAEGEHQVEDRVEVRWVVQRKYLLLLVI